MHCLLPSWLLRKMGMGISNGLCIFIFYCTGFNYTVQGKKLIVSFMQHKVCNAFLLNPLYRLFKPSYIIKPGSEIYHPTILK